MNQVNFDEETAEKLEVMYQARDVMRRRVLVRKALGPLPGERIIDIGCGPGFYVAELLDDVGPDGAVMGVGAADAMLALATKRCHGRENASFEQADATALPAADRNFDVALSVQVMEPVPDVRAALAEIHRVLRPGGRGVIWEVDWATLSWCADDPEAAAVLHGASEGGTPFPQAEDDHREAVVTSTGRSARRGGRN